MIKKLPSILLYICRQKFEVSLLFKILILFFLAFTCGMSVRAQTSGINLVKTAELYAANNNITYTLTITNTGTLPLYNIVLSDDKLKFTPIDPTLVLNAGRTIVLVINYAITLNEKDAGKVSNIASVTASSSPDVSVKDVSGPTTITNGSTVTIVPETPSIILVKTAVLSDDKKSIDYTFVITNTGNVTLNNLLLTDPKFPGAFTFDPAEKLLSKASKTLTYRYVITQADQDADEVTNTATASGVSPVLKTRVSDVSGSTAGDDNPTVILLPENPSVKMVKTGRLSTDGNTITYSFAITNTGDVTLKNLTITDPKITGAYTFSPAGSLSPNATAIATASYTISQIEKDAGNVTNTATVTGTTIATTVTDISGTAQDNDNPTLITVPSRPSIKLLKTGSLSTDKSAITYTFVLTNTGNVTLNNLTLTDPKLPAFSIAPNTKLIPGRSITLTANYGVTQVDMDAAMVSNTATTTGMSPTGNIVNDISGTAQTNDTPTIVSVPENASVTLVKTGVLSADSRTILYTFTITNTGNVTLKNIALVDAKIVGPFNFSSTGNLAPQGTRTGTVTYTITQADRDADKVTNTAIVTASSLLGTPVSDVSGTSQNNNTLTVVAIPEHPALKLVKTGTLSTNGNTITYSFSVVNTGDVTLKNLIITDSKVTGAYAFIPANSVAPNSTTIATASYTLSQAEKDAGSVTNTATVTGTSTGGTASDISGTAQSNDNPTVTIIPPNPSINLVKTGVLSADKTKINYTFIITNTGNVTVNNLTLSDVKLPAFTIAPAVKIAPGSTNTQIAAYVITQAEKDLTSVSNTAKAGAASPKGVTVTDLSGTTSGNNNPTVINVPESPSIRLVKRGVLNAANHTITYTFSITNTGNVTLRNIVLTDSKITGPFVYDHTGDLAPQATATAVATYAITQSDRDANQVTNTAVVKGQSYIGTLVTDISGTTRNNDVSTVTLIPESPSVTLVKTGLLSTDGNKINYTFTIKNTGTVTLKNITLTDAKVPQPYVFSSTSNLAPGATVTATGAYVVNQAEKDAGKVINTAMVTGASAINVVSDVSGTAENNNTQTTTLIPEHASLSLVKTGILSQDKNKVNYTFTITNTGNVTLSKLKLSDPKLSAFVINPALAVLPGASTIITGVYTINQTEKDARVVSNTATATGLSTLNTLAQDYSGTTSLNNNPTVVSVPEHPSLTLVKTGRLSLDQNTITYTFVITNNGSVTLNNLALTDAKLLPFVIPAAETLAPGLSKTLVASYRVLQSDKDAGLVTNTGNVTGFSPAGTRVADISGTTSDNNVQTVVLIPEHPSVTLVKTGVYNADNNTITYTFTITNTGTVTLKNLTLTDPKIVGPFLFGSTGDLSPGHTVVATASYTVPADEKAVGQVINTATVRAVTANRTIVSDVSGTAQDNDINTIIIVSDHPSINLVKTGLLSADGNMITYTFNITNSGDLTLKNLTLTDAKLPGVFVISADEVLHPGVSKILTANYTISQAEKDRRQVSNTATVRGMSYTNRTVTDVSGTSLERDEPTVISVPEHAALNLIKTGIASADGNTVSYTFKLKNTGNVTLKNLTLTDDRLSAFVIDPLETLAPGMTKTLTAGYTVTQFEKDAGRVINTANATGQSFGGITVNDISGVTQNSNQPTVVVVPQIATLRITKVATGIIPSISGGTVNYTLRVTNTGTVTLRNIIVSDQNAAITNGSPIPELASNASVIVTGSHQLTQDEIDGGKVINQASARGIDPNGNAVVQVSDDPSTGVLNDPTITPISALASIKLVKTGVVNIRATVATYTFTITNTGNVTLTNIILKDPLLGGVVSLSQTALSPGQSMVLTQSYNLTQQDRDRGSVSNSATVTTVTPAGVTVSDISGTDLSNDTPTVIIINTIPDINLVMTGIITADFSSITYSFRITNTGNITLTHLSITDAKLGSSIILSNTVIEPGGVVTGTAVYSVTAQEKRDGLVSNTATITGYIPSGVAISDVSGTESDNDTPTVIIIDDFPQAINDHVETTISHAVTFTITGNDLPSFNGLDAGSVVITKFPLYGQLQLQADGTVTYTPDKGYAGPDDFTYTVKDLKGKVSNRALVNITVSLIDLFIPNTITPNGDGKNDTFKIIGKEDFDTIDLMVMNRWGNEVYHNKNYQDNWDGSNLGEGTYYYIIILKKGATQVVKKGWVLLKR